MGLWPLLCRQRINRGVVVVLVLLIVVVLVVVVVVVIVVVLGTTILELRWLPPTVSQKITEFD